MVDHGDFVVKDSRIDLVAKNAFLENGLVVAVPVLARLVLCLVAAAVLVLARPGLRLFVAAMLVAARPVLGLVVGAFVAVALAAAVAAGRSGAGCDLAVARQPGRDDFPVVVRLLHRAG